MRRPITLLMMALLLAGCRSNHEPLSQERPAVPVLASPPLVQDVPLTIEVIGTLKPSVSVDIRPQVAGTLKQVWVQEGEIVKAGQQLALIDPGSREIAVQEAAAQLSMERSNLTAAQKKIERYRNLALKDLVAQVEWDELMTQEAKAQAAVEISDARLKSAKMDLEDCTLSASIDGQVGKLDLAPGMWVDQGSVLGTISKQDPLLLEFSLTEEELSRLPTTHIDAKVESLCKNKGESCAKGTISFLDDRFDSKTGLLLVRGKVPNAEHQFRAGQSVRIYLPIGVNAAARLVPQKAVKYNENGPYLHIVSAEKTVLFKPVKLGDEREGYVIITDGVEPEDLVITDGHLRLSLGTKVDVNP